MKNEIVQTRLDRPSLLFTVNSLLKPAPTVWRPIHRTVANSDRHPVPQELQQLVAPIALYPDCPRCSSFAASTYPTEIVEAERWMQVYPNLKAKSWLEKLINTLGPERESPHTIPSVLENMDQEPFLDVIPWRRICQPAAGCDGMPYKPMRQQARKAGQLNSNEQEKVRRKPHNRIQPANPDVVYVPAYDPWLVYGDPIVAYPGWVPVPGIFYGGPSVYFGGGFGIGFFGGFGWGWHHWD